jgi:AhpD family alkylhydroperoxidase
MTSAHRTAYPVHAIESAPEQSRPALEGLRKSLGIVPNLAATMAGSPALLNSFVGAFASFHGGSFSGAERQVLLLTNAVANRCAWAVAFHSTLALREGVAADDLRALREGRLPSPPRWRALSALTRALIEKRGHLDDAELDAFTAAGFAPAQVLEVIAGLSVSTMANYAGNVARPPVEEPFHAQRWSAGG